MAFDGLTLACVVDEIRPLCEGARIQRISFTSQSDLALEIYTPFYRARTLLLATSSEGARVALLPTFPASGVQTDTPFRLLARKHLRAAHIRGIHQPPLERLLELSLEQRDDDGQQYTLRLIVEVMGRRSNLVLVASDGLIYDAVRRAPASMNPRRPVLPHLPYVPPPPQKRVNPGDFTSELLVAAAEAAGGRLSSVIVQQVAGLSPQTAREIVYRAMGSPDASAREMEPAAVIASLREVCEPLASKAWTPTIAAEVSGVGVAYAPYVLTHLQAAGLIVRTVDSMSEAIQVGSSAGASRPRDPLLADRRALYDRLRAAISGHRRRLSALQHQVASSDEIAALRRNGETILSNLGAIGSRATLLEANGASIELDERLGPVQNAQAYFAWYRKRRGAAERVPLLLSETLTRLEFLEYLATLVDVADSVAGIKALRQEVADGLGKVVPPSSNPGKRRRPSVKSAPPFRQLALGEAWRLYIGSSASGNAHVTFEVGKPADLWLHARGVPGAHVLIQRRSGSGDVPDVVQVRAASIAAWYSAARSAGSVEVDVVPRRLVRKIAGGPLGLVRYEGERTIRVSASPPSAEDVDSERRFLNR